MKIRTIAMIILMAVTCGQFFYAGYQKGLRQEPITDCDTKATFEDLLDAIEWVESKGDANAIGDGGKAIGSFQIHKIYVDDVNRISRLRHDDKYSSPIQYSYRHREFRTSSRWMVNTYLTHYGGTFEEMARKHNGGPDGHRKESTKKYWLKVKARLHNYK